MNLNSLKDSDLQLLLEEADSISGPAGYSARRRIEKVRRNRAKRFKRVVDRALKPKVSPRALLSRHWQQALAVMFSVFLAYFLGGTNVHYANGDLKSEEGIISGVLYPHEVCPRCRRIRVSNVNLETPNEQIQFCIHGNIEKIRSLKKLVGSGAKVAWQKYILHSNLPYLGYSCRLARRIYGEDGRAIDLEFPFRENSLRRRIIKDTSYFLLPTFILIVLSARISRIAWSKRN